MGEGLKDIGNIASMIEDSDLILQSIGTQMEKTLHKSIKHYLCPDAMCHEFKIGTFIADIYQNGKITEIQTGSFRSMESKLSKLLDHYPITIVYPVIRKKTIYRMDSGASSKPVRSPKTGQPLSIASELVQIRSHLLHPNLDFIIFMVDVDEYRVKSLDPSNRKAYDRIDQFAKGVPQLISLRTKQDYVDLLPKTLPEQFTVVELMKAAKLNQTDAQALVTVLRDLNVIFHAGKRGRAFLYQFVS